MSDSLFDKCVRRLEEQPMSDILNDYGQMAGYGNTPEAVRYHTPNPYISIWAVDAENKDRDYSPPHKHDYPELNVIAAQTGELVYKILIGDEESEVVSNSGILIPPGVEHSANLQRGKGIFFVLRLRPEQIAASYRLGQQFTQE